MKTPLVKLGNLTENQRKIAMQMLTEETESFSQNEDDVRCIEGLQMNLELSDTSPVNFYTPTAVCQSQALCQELLC